MAKTTIPAGYIAANAITSTEIAANAINTATIAANAITAAHIAGNAVTASELHSAALSGQNFTGDVTFDTNVLFVDSSNDRVGIGTTGPLQKVVIDINSSNTTQLSLDGIVIGNSDTTANNGSAIVFSQSGTNGNSNSRIGVINTDRTASSEDQDMFFGTLGAGAYGERMRITSTGNVGIGTTSPNLSSGASGSTVLTISATASARNALIELDGTRANDGDPVSYFRTFNNTAATPLTDIRSIRGASDTSGSLEFYTSNAKAMTIDSSGNLGIGTSSPTTPLSIRKAHSASYGSGVDMLDFKAYFPGYDTETSKASIFAGTSDKHTLNTNGGYLAFKVNQSGYTGTAGATNLAEVMRIEKDGNVGIGTTVPAAYLGFDAHAYQNGTEDSSSIRWNDVGTADSILQGYTIGTDGANLWVGANSYVNSGGGISAFDTAKKSAYVSVSSYIGGLAFGSAASGNPTEAMRIDSSGNVGIGTSSPSGLLHVDSGLAHNHIKFVTNQQSGTGYDVTLDVTGGGNNSEMKVRMGTISNPSREQIVGYNGNLTLYNNGVARHNYYSGGHSAEQSVTNGIGYYNYVGWIDSTGTDYIHIKTNVSKSNWMMKFWYEGYAYSAHNARSSITFYSYEGVSYVYIPSITQQSSNSSYSFTTPYYSSDNYVVLVIYHPSNYTGLNLWAQSNDDHGSKEIKVLGITGSSNSTGVY